MLVGISTIFYYVHNIYAIYSFKYTKKRENEIISNQGYYTTLEAIKKTLVEVDEDKDEKGVVEVTKDESKREGHEEGTMKEVDKKETTEEEKQKEKNVLEVHMLSASPPHMKDVDQQT